MDDKIEVQFDDRGLAPAVVQDATSGEILMVAWMNARALQLTQRTGQAHFWSRSRQELWHKGATSGNFLNVREILVDCDADTLLLKVDPAGPACHTDQRSCFYQYLKGPAGDGSDQGKEPHILQALFDVICDRLEHQPEGSYTVELMAAGEDEVLKKVGEEAMETILAAKGQGDQRLVSEIADLLYHVLVLLAVRELSLTDVEAELERRRS